jgi:hypothetical protein
VGEALSWAMTAAAVLLMLYALRVVLQGRDPEKPGQQAGLGCGFFFLACLLWSLASHDWVGGWWNAFRLGLGIFLVTPAIGALTKPHGARLFIGVVGMILGILLAGPVVKQLALGYQDHQDSAPRLALEARAGELREAQATLTVAVAQLQAELVGLTTSLQQTDHVDFASFSTDPAALASLERLGKVEQLIDLARSRLAQVTSDLELAEDALAKDVEQEEEAGLLKVLGVHDSDAPSEDDLTPVEVYAKQKRLQVLFEGLK